MVEAAKEGGHTPILRAWVGFEVGSSWSTNLWLPAPEIARLYEDHGTSEQFHSELKGELDLERLPSGKFKTNELVFQLGCLAYNLLRVLAIKGKAVFRHRNPSKRRRLKTVIQELILLPARFLGGSDQMKLDLGKSHPGKDAILALHRELIPRSPKLPDLESPTKTPAQPGPAQEPQVIRKKPGSPPDATLNPETHPATPTNGRSVALLRRWVWLTDQARETQIKNGIPG